MRQKNEKTVSPILSVSCLVFLAGILYLFVSSCIYAQSVQEEFLFISGSLKERGAQTIVEVKGYASFPDKTKVYLFLKYQDIMAKASLAYIQKERFLGKLGPFSKPLCPGKWSLIAQIKKEGGRDVVSNTTIKVGTQDQINSVTKTSEEFLKKELSEIEAIYQEMIKECELDVKDSKIKDLKEWLQGFKDRLNAVSDRVSKYKEQWLIPIFPTTTDVSIQIPAKVQSFGDLVVKSRNLKEHFEMFRKDIENNIDRAQIELKRFRKEKVDLETMAQDGDQLRKLYASLKEDTEQFPDKIQKISKYYEMWEIWAQGWESSLIALSEEVPKYKRASQTDEKYKAVHKEFEDAMDNIKSLWTLHIEELQQKFPPCPVSLSQNVMAARHPQIDRKPLYHRRLQETIEKWTGQMNEHRKVLAERLEQDYASILQWFQQSDKMYAMGKQNVAQWSKWAAECQLAMNQSRTKAMDYNKQDFKYFYPKANAIVTTLTSCIISLTAEMDMDINKQPEYSTGRNQMRSYSRKERIATLQEQIVKTLTEFKQMLSQK